MMRELASIPITIIIVVSLLAGATPPSVLILILIDSPFLVGMVTC